MRTKVFLLLLLFVPCCLAVRAGEEDGEEEVVLTPQDIPARIAEAEVGEWALYRLADGGHSRLTVVEKWEEHGDTYLIIQNELIKPRKKRGRIKDERVNVTDAVRELRDLHSEDRITEADVLVHGRRLKTVVVHFVEDGKVIRQSYFSDKIPVYGLVRGVSPTAKEKNTLTLVDYGFAEDTE